MEAAELTSSGGCPEVDENAPGHVLIGLERLAENRLDLIWVEDAGRRLFLAVHLEFRRFGEIAFIDGPIKRRFDGTEVGIDRIFTGALLALRALEGLDLFV